MTQPLAGVCVLDFSTLLPGPLASLLLAEAGAEVIKIERPGSGDEALAAINPRIVYCAITGYGQSGPKAQVAAHGCPALGADNALIGG